jgi:hypothetical protein
LDFWFSIERFKNPSELVGVVGSVSRNEDEAF